MRWSPQCRSGSSNRPTRPRAPPLASRPRRSICLPPSAGTRFCAERRRWCNFTSACVPTSGTRSHRSSRRTVRPSLRPSGCFSGTSGTLRSTGRPETGSPRASCRCFTGSGGLSPRLGPSLRRQSTSGTAQRWDRCSDRWRPACARWTRAVPTPWMCPTVHQRARCRPKSCRCASTPACRGRWRRPRLPCSCVAPTSWPRRGRPTPTPFSATSLTWTTRRRTATGTGMEIVRTATTSTTARWRCRRRGRATGWST